MKIGKRISLSRISKGLTQKEFADKYGKSIDRVEQGDIDIKFRDLLEVCKILEINIWDLTAEIMIITIKD